MAFGIRSTRFSLFIFQLCCCSSCGRCHALLKNALIYHDKTRLHTYEHLTGGCNSIPPNKLLFRCPEHASTCYSCELFPPRKCRQTRECYNARGPRPPVTRHGRPERARAHMRCSVLILVAGTARSAPRTFTLPSSADVRSRVGSQHMISHGGSSAPHHRATKRADNAAKVAAQCSAPDHQPSCPPPCSPPE